VLAILATLVFLLYFTVQGERRQRALGADLDDRNPAD